MINRRLLGPRNWRERLVFLVEGIKFWREIRAEKKRRARKQ